MNTLKLTKIGNSVGVVLPRELLARLDLDAGDTVYFTESPDGREDYALPHFADQMQGAGKVMSRR